MPTLSASTRLFRHGGIYTDIDTVFIRRFPDELRACSFVAERETDLNDEASVGNAALAAEPGAVFAKRWREAMAGALDGWSDHSTMLPAHLAAANPAEVHLEPTVTFYPFGYTPLDLLRLLQADEPGPLEAISVHLWEHLWRDEWRTDFSTFHAGMVTLEDIREVDTTLFRLLRPFLPAP
jgi:hypothetical protein